MNWTFHLPQVSFSFNEPIPEKQLILAAGGREPQGEWLTKACAQRDIWCVDRGIDSCWKNQILPKRMIGDGDSASSEGWQWGRTLGIPIEEHPKEKNLTDLQLALNRAGDIHPRAAVILTGVWGGRFDHAFSNIYTLLGSTAWGIQRACAADEKEVLLLLKGKEEVAIKAEPLPSLISLLPLSESCTGVSIEGVHWPLHQVILSQGLPYAVSNRPSGQKDEINVSVETGWLGVYLCWDEKSICQK